MNIHGHGHPAIVAAIAAQAARIDHVLLAGFTHDAAEELRGCLRKILPANLSHIFFSDDGSTAVEVALKTAVQYWQNVGRPGKKAIVALDHAYHGDTVGAMSVGAGSSFTARFASCCFPCIACIPPIVIDAPWGKHARRARSIAWIGWSGCSKKSTERLRR